MKNLALITLAWVATLGLTVAAKADVNITPTTAGACSTLFPAVTCSLAASGNQTSQSLIDAAITAAVGAVTEIYKQNVGGSESGSVAGSYTTTFDNAPNDPQDAKIVWDGAPDPFISSSPIYLLLKDGNQTPAWYLFKIENWNGKETINMTGFWPKQGAISHVSIYGGTTSVPDSGLTLMLLGGALVGLETLRRRFRS
jgi:hypothetical protein